MVGHTAVMPAVIKAVETVDECVGSILDWCDKNGGTILLTADHGNAEQCIDDNGQPMTKHTTAPVPFVVNDKSLKLRDGGALRDIAPTILDLLGTEKPEEMEGVLQKNQYKNRQFRYGAENNKSVFDKAICSSSKGKRVY